CSAWQARALLAAWEEPPAAMKQRTLEQQIGNGGGHASHAACFELKRGNDEEVGGLEWTDNYFRK
ncbi:unnamed protein product, partial [Urochloa humidicola]